MFLARFEVDPRKREARKYLGKPQALHAAIMKAAAPQDGEQGRVLWRIDEFGDRIFVVLLSPREPDLTVLEEEAGIAGSTKVGNYQLLRQKLAAGQQWRFRLTANPTRSLSTTVDMKTSEPLTSRPKRGKVVGHVTVEYQREWLVKRAEQLGVRFLQHPGESDPTKAAEVRVVGRTRLAFERFDPHQARKRTVTINRATFEGALEIVDVDKFWQALTEGIGRAKAYGCGLMTLVV